MKYLITETQRQKIKEYFDTEVILGSYFVDECELE